MEELDIKEAFTPGDTDALRELANRACRENALFVEIGCWKGYSTAILAESIINSRGNVYAVDHWQGNFQTWNYAIAQSYDIYALFKTNMIALGLWSIVHPLVMSSQMASRIFADNILDLVFIDADHRYDYIKQDILLWLPKLKEGGILCGHDCEGYYSVLPEVVREVIDKHLGDDFIPGIAHPGVIRALHDCLNDKYSIMPNSVIWYYIKGERIG